MSKEFSAHWKSSKKPSKQRKYLRNSPLHIKQKIMKSTLSKELKQKTNMNSLSPRKGDSVKIMKGSHKGKKGKISEVKLKQMKVYVEGIEVKKRDGTKVTPPIHASNLMIVGMVEDKRRLKKTTSSKVKSVLTGNKVEGEKNEQKTS